MSAPPTRKQFTASFNGDYPFPGAESLAVGALTVHHSPDLPVTRVVVDGDAGLVLGWPTHLDGRAELTRGDLGELSGCWLAITERTVIPDPMGSYASVYSPELGVVASTTAMLPEDHLKPRTSLNETLGLPERDNFYPFGLTPHVNVSRLLPSHELSLQDWSVTRHGKPVVEMTEDQAITTIAENLARNVSTVAAQQPVMLGVTAGNETRMLLAGLRGYTDDVYGYTFATSKTMDTVAAERLARLTGIGWEIRPNKVDADVSARWFHDVGQCIAGQTLRNAAGKELLPTDRVFLKGMGGEIARAYYYMDKPIAQNQSFTPEGLVHAMWLPPHPDFTEGAARWMETVDAVDAYDLLDLAYRESRVGGWQAPQLHADTRTLHVSYPLNQTSTLDAMRALPVEVKRAEQLSPLVVGKLWPELLEVPINQDLPVRRVARKAKHLVSALRARG